MQFNALQSELSAALSNHQRVNDQLGDLRGESEAATARLEEELQSSRKEGATTAGKLAAAEREHAADRNAAEDALAAAGKVAAAAEDDLTARMESAAQQAALEQAGLSAQLASLEAETDQAGVSLAAAVSARHVADAHVTEMQVALVDAAGILAASENVVGELGAQIASAEVAMSAAQQNAVLLMAEVDGLRISLAAAAAATVAAAVHSEGAAMAAAEKYAVAQQRIDAAASELDTSQAEIAKLGEALTQGRAAAEREACQWTVRVSDVTDAAGVQLTEARVTAASQLAEAAVVAAAERSALKAELTAAAEEVLAMVRKRKSAKKVEAAKSAALQAQLDATDTDLIRSREAEAHMMTSQDAAAVLHLAATERLQSDVSAAQEATRNAEAQACAAVRRGSALHASLTAAQEVQLNV